MAVITLPTALKIGADCAMGQRRFDTVAMSDSNGTQQARLLGPPRWTLALLQPEKLTLAEAGQWQALLLQLRGRVNVLAAWNPLRPAPMGTLRGTLTLSAGAALGATSISVTGGAGEASRTLLAGDCLQIGTGLGTSQLVMITAAATADGLGIIALSIEPPLRTTFANGAAVTWDKPLAHYRVTSDAASWTYGSSGVLVTGMSLDLLECWN